ncbi:unnamed protein product, partial [marine sediment metagenome]
GGIYRPAYLSMSFYPGELVQYAQIPKNAYPESLLS